MAPTYGYFPMLDFALPWLRAKKARALQTQYCDGSSSIHEPASVSSATAMAPICWGAHSEAAGMRFHRVTLAASVLPRDYRWRRPFSRGQVRKSATIGPRAMCPSASCVTSFDRSG